MEMCDVGNTYAEIPDNETVNQKSLEDDSECCTMESFSSEPLQSHGTEISLNQTLFQEYFLEMSIPMETRSG